MPDLVAAASGGNRRDALAAMRDLLAKELEPTVHQPGCACECGAPAASARDMAALVKELRAVLLEIEKLPGGEVVSDLDRIASRVDAGRDDLAERRAHRRTAGADPPRA